MTYNEAISWLFEQFPAYQQVGISAYKPDVDNVVALCEQLDVDFNQLKYIHVAGTNGKGSTCNFLASILQESGFRTGLFTSPHILDFRERIRVDGKMIEEQKVIDFCLRIQKSKLRVKPSFFEITFILSLEHFINQKCDYCVVETGLGGRLDATNIIQPILSIITNIGFDHTALLGNTYEEIAFEKAGIIKKLTPVVIGETNDQTKKVFLNKASAMESPIYFAEDFTMSAKIYPAASYLSKNEHLARVSSKFLSELEQIELKTDEGVKNTPRNTGFFGRLHCLQDKPLILLDAAHNKEGLKSLFQSIHLEQYQNTHILFGTTSEKEITELVDLFPPKAAVYFSSFKNPRSKTVNDFEVFNKNSQKKWPIFEKVHHAIEYIQPLVNENDIWIVTGSFFLLSDFFAFFSKKDLSN